MVYSTVDGASIMQYFKTPTGQIRAIDQGQKHLIAADWFEMTEAEVQAVFNPPKSLADLAGDQRLSLEVSRMAAETVGVTHSGIRYAGDPSNRQALREALDLAAETGQTTFASWKDSD